MNYSINYLFRFATANLGSLTAATAAATAMASALGRAGSAAAGLGIVGAAGGAALGGMFVAAVKEAAKFEDKLAEIRKVVPDMTKDQMWKMGEQVQRLAIWSGAAKEEIADIFAGGARMGIRGEEALTRFAETVTKVKVAWDGVSASMAGEEMGKIAGRFFGDLSPVEAQKQMVGVADSINYLGQNIAGVKPLEMLKFFGRAGPLLKGARLTAHETAAFGAAAISSGVSGSLEGTQAAAAFMRIDQKALIEPKRMAMMRKIGVDPKKYIDIRRTQGGAAAALTLMEAVARLPEEKHMQVLGALLGDARAGRQMKAMVGQINKFKQALASTDINWAKKLMKDKAFMEWLKVSRPDEYARLLSLTPLGQTLSAGSVDQEFKARMDTMVQQMNRVSEAWDYVLVQLGKSYLPKLTPYVSSLADALERLGSNRESLESLTRTATTFFGAAGLAGIGMLTTKLLTATGAITGFTAGAMSLKGALFGLMAFGAIALTIGITWMAIDTFWRFYDHWTKLEQASLAPLNFKITFDLPGNWEVISGFIDKVLWWSNVATGMMQGGGSPGIHGTPAPTWRGDVSGYGGMGMPVFSQHARRMANEAARLYDPHTSFGRVAPPAPLGMWDSIRGVDPNWGSSPFSGATPYGGASAVPASMNQKVSVEATTTFQPAFLQVQYNGPIGGPDSVSLQANPARGQSTAESGGGSGRPWAQ